MKRAIIQITLWMVLLVSNLVFSRATGGKAKEKSLEVPRIMEVQYDDYPMIVPKRAAMLLDRLMVALHHALEKGEGQDGSGRPINKVYRDAKYGGRPVTTGMVKQHQSPPLTPPLLPGKTEQLMKSYYAEAEAEDSEVENAIPDELEELEGRKELLDEMVKNDLY
ncbi:uncharacterized protein LOC131430415 isoform X2 [Malaya genurostris]|uniref:uncharacterized protein LOC131430415 isoform X2 n=1 Tax=Malaya genurostris TaxID=325434 RepID=UPI0026F40757|nr:uncharacterized protein LOC131430415 isoform X2 [Malaya genurostris]